MASFVRSIRVYTIENIIVLYSFEFTLHKKKHKICGISTDNSRLLTSYCKNMKCWEFLQICTVSIKCKISMRNIPDTKQVTVVVVVAVWRLTAPVVVDSLLVVGWLQVAALSVQLELDCALSDGLQDELEQVWGVVEAWLVGWDVDWSW